MKHEPLCTYDDNRGWVCTETCPAVHLRAKQATALRLAEARLRKELLEKELAELKRGLHAKTP